MISRRLILPVLVASLWLAACRRDPPPPPGPTGPSAEELEAQRIRDSIAAAEAAARAAAAAEAAARAEAERRMAAARATLEEMVYFDYDESAIRTDAERVLRQKAEILRSSPAVMLRIEGHADERGSTEYNLALGNRRAESVRQFLTNFGLGGNRFSITSYGEERPQATGSNEATWARNRRAEFAITAGADQITPPTGDR
jgi:peptidoglycan-associated lipoprotein